MTFSTWVSNFRVSFSHPVKSAASRCKTCVALPLCQLPLSRYPSRLSGISACTLRPRSFMSCCSLSNVVAISSSTHQLASDRSEQQSSTLSQCRMPRFTWSYIGFSSCVFERWFDAKWGKMRSEHRWVKAHLMTGVTTNIVTSVEVTPTDSNDCPHLEPLLETTAKQFAVAEVSADKAYLSKRNLELIVNAGAVPYIPFKSDTTGEGPELWRRMFHFYQFKRTEFLASYHKRSNVESTFSMIKRKFGASVRSKTPVAQINEVLCKVICHNLCVLVQSIYELGIEPTFWASVK